MRRAQPLCQSMAYRTGTLLLYAFPIFILGMQEGGQLRAIILLLDWGPLAHQLTIL